jgi:hypothetical protein
MSSRDESAEAEPWPEEVGDDPRCREDPLGSADAERVLLTALTSLPLRAGFTEEVFARIRRAGLLDRRN